MCHWRNLTLARSNRSQDGPTALLSVKSLLAKCSKANQWVSVIMQQTQDQQLVVIYFCYKNKVYLQRFLEGLALIRPLSLKHKLLYQGETASRNPLCCRPWYTPPSPFGYTGSGPGARSLYTCKVSPSPHPPPNISRPVRKEIGCHFWGVF